MMDNMGKVDYWVEIAAYDLSIAKELLNINRFLYVGFMCHQAIEKIFKAMFVVKFPAETPPYTHKLIKLAELTNLYEKMLQEQRDFIDTLEPLNIEARYPSVKNDLYSSLNRERCEQIYKKTEGLFQWIKAQL
jgi:HEPN domain-containing protein